MNNDLTHVFITDYYNHIIFPFYNTGNFWKLQNHQSTRAHYVSFFRGPSHGGVTWRVDRGQKLRIWYGEAYNQHNDNDNSGRQCVDVYAVIN